MKMREGKRKREENPENDPNSIVEKREELMVTPAEFGDGEEVLTLREAHFLKPSIHPKNEAFPKPKPPPLSLSSNLNFKKLTKLKFFKGSSKPLDSWREWVETLQQTHQNSWIKAGIFEAIRVSTYNIKENTSLVMELAEKWYPETNTFVFSWGEATITLEDVMILGGFSVLGFSVVELPHNSKIKVLENKLEKALAKIRGNHLNHVSHVAWMKYFRGKGGEMEHVALLVLWLSRYVFSNNSYCISNSVFLIAINLAMGTPIALAPSVLAAIYRDLKLLKQEIKAFTDGNLGSIGVVSALFQLVQVWAWERFSALGPQPASLAPGEPRVASWDYENKAKIDSMVEIEHAGDSFIWKPYALNVRNCDQGMWVKLTSCTDVQRRSFARCLMPCVLNGVDCMEKYHPHRVGRQFGFDQDIPDSVPNCNADVDVVWFSYFKPLDGLVFYLPPRMFNGEVTTEYSKWWSRKTPLHVKDQATHAMRFSLRLWGRKTRREKGVRRERLNEVENGKGKRKLGEGKQKDHKQVRKRKSREECDKSVDSETQSGEFRTYSTSSIEKSGELSVDSSSSSEETSDTGSESSGEMWGIKSSKYGRIPSPSYAYARHRILKTGELGSKEEKQTGKEEEEQRYKEQDRKRRTGESSIIPENQVFSSINSCRSSNKMCNECSSSKSFSCQNPVDVGDMSMVMGTVKASEEIEPNSVEEDVNGSFVNKGEGSTYSIPCSSAPRNKAKGFSFAASSKDMEIEKPLCDSILNDSPPNQKNKTDQLLGREEVGLEGMEENEEGEQKGSKFSGCTETNSKSQELLEGQEEEANKENENKVNNSSVNKGEGSTYSIHCSSPPRNEATRFNLVGTSNDMEIENLPYDSILTENPPNQENEMNQILAKIEKGHVGIQKDEEGEHEVTKSSKYSEGADTNSKCQALFEGEQGEERNEANKGTDTVDGALFASDLVPAEEENPKKIISSIINDSMVDISNSEDDCVIVISDLDDFASEKNAYEELDRKLEAKINELNRLVSAIRKKFGSKS